MWRSKIASLFWALMVVGSVGCLDGGDDPVINTNAPEVTNAGPLSIDEKDMAASLSGADMWISAVLRSSTTGVLSGTFTISVEDLDGNVLRSGSESFKMDGKAQTISVEVDALGDLSVIADQAVRVVRYQIDTELGTLKGVRSLFMVVPQGQVIVLGPQSYHAGENTRVKVLARDPVSGEPLANRQVTLRTVEETGMNDVELTTDEFGAASVDIAFEDTGSAKVQALMAMDSGNEIVADQSVEVVRVRKVLVTTDKPIYQPGQTIHIRTLSLNQPGLTPDKAVDCTIEVFDGKGNKVFKKMGPTSDFGIAFARFQLASQINMGTYRIRATVGDVVTEKAVTVETYSLPKFEVGLTLDKGFYVLGEQVKGTVNAQYFFGKSVGGGAVKVVLSAFDVEFTEIETVTGVTGDEGIFGFTVTIPEFMVGQTLEQGLGLVRLAVEVTDTAGQLVSKELAITVAQDPLSVAVIPESGTIVPGLENRFFVFVENPAGGAVEAKVTIAGAGDDLVVNTDESGLASFVLTPGAEGVSLTVTAVDDLGVTVMRSFSFGPGSQEEALLVRTNRALYSVGDTAVVTVLAPDARDRIYLDVLRSGQVVREEAFDLTDGQGQVQVDLDQEMTGDVVFSAFYMGAKGQIIRDEKMTFVQGADSLKITVTPDKDMYEPADPVSVTFDVTKGDGSPAVAALGIQVVDEAVFALSDSQPGLLKTYFELEEAILEPHFQVDVNRFDVAGIVTKQPENTEDAAVLESKAEAAFAAIGDSTSNASASSWSQALTSVKSALNPYFERDKSSVITTLVNRYFDDWDWSYESEQDVIAYLLNQTEFFDFFGNLYIFTCDDGYSIYMKSKGPDELFGTDDDYVGFFYLYDLYRGNEMEDGEWGGQPGGFADAAAASDAGTAPTKNEKDDEENGGVRIRSYFPETLKVLHEVITDENGRATISFDMADSITEWRMSSLANSIDGLLGSNVTGLTVFKDFFVDIDVPRNMTRGDEVHFPIAIYNYLPIPQKVDLEIEVGDWADMLSSGSASVNIGPGDVIGLNIGIRAKSVGWHGVLVKATGSEGAVDAVLREIEVVPDGIEVRGTDSGKLAGTVTKTVTFPDFAIEGTPSAMVKIYPGVMSQAVEGLDSLLQMPSGCFEQTTATLWPNALVLQYMQETGQVTPDIELKAREYVSLGYQRLLTYECSGGGFTWFGDPDPANVILTAMGVMEFADIEQVQDIDETLIPRTAEFLLGKQNSDGSWHENQGSEFATVQYTDLMTTCFVSWAMGSAGYSTGGAMSYIKANLGLDESTYALALCANSLAVNAGSDSFTGQVFGELADRAVSEDGGVYWESGVTDQSMYYYGEEESGKGSIEVTALATLAMLRAQRSLDLVGGAITYLASNKDSFGNWGTTHATILSLKAFVKALTAMAEEAAGTVYVTINGSQYAPLAISKANQDVFHQFELDQDVKADGPNEITVKFEGDGSLMYQIVWSHYEEGSLGQNPEGPLTIDIDYDKTSLAVDETIDVNVVVTNVSSADAPMVLIDLGIPPGFDVVTDGLSELVANETIEKFEMTARQIMVYVDVIRANEALELNYQLKAKYPLKVQCPDSGAKLYYDESSKSTTTCLPIQVNE